MYNLTICVPGIRPENWIRLLQDIKKSCTKYTYEVIFCSPNPNPLPPMQDVRYVQEFGTPSRAVMTAACIAEGSYFTWLVDDTLVCPGALDSAMDLLISKESKDIICLRYIEGPGYRNDPALFGDFYWTARYHTGLHMPGVDLNWKLAMLPLMYLPYFKEMGGLDCRFEHINFNVHDFNFRAQRNGSEIYLSPDLVMYADWDPHRTAQNSPIIAAHEYNDHPLFKEVYKDDSRPVFIDFDNWKHSERVWSRRNHNIQVLK